MFKIIIYSICAAAFVAALSWKDCLKNETNRAIKVEEFKVVPEKITFPGNYNVTLHLSFIRRVKHFMIEFELIRYIFGYPLKLPCRDSTIIGTCNNIDICSQLNSSLQDTGHNNSYGHKIERLMNKTTGHFLKCPVEPVNITADNEPVQLGNISSIINLLVNGDYTIRERAIENKTVIGCIEVNVTLAGQPGSIFG